MPTLEELVAETEKVMTHNLARALYGPNATVTPKPLHERAKNRVGEFFLRLANRLGAYNDDY
jgi:hypothetical protein